MYEKIGQNYVRLWKRSTLLKRKGWEQAKMGINGAQKRSNLVLGVTLHGKITCLGADRPNCWMFQLDSGGHSVHLQTLVSYKMSVPCGCGQNVFVLVWLGPTGHVSYKHLIMTWIWIKQLSKVWPLEWSSKWNINIKICMILKHI